jgi:hypothetical protein
MSVRHMFAVAEASADPLTIPAAPVAVPRADLLDTEAVYRGAVDTANLIGFIRDDGLVSGDLIARTRGNASSPADIKRFTHRNDALTWLSRAVDGVVPRKKWQRRAAP